MHLHIYLKPAVLLSNASATLAGPSSQTLIASCLRSETCTYTPGCRACALGRYAVHLCCWHACIDDMTAQTDADQAVVPAQTSTVHGLFAATKDALLQDRSKKTMSFIKSCTWCDAIVQQSYELVRTHARQVAQLFDVAVKACCKLHHSVRWTQ